MFVLFSQGLFGHFESSPFFEKWGYKLHTKAVKQDDCSQFLKVQQLSQFVLKSPATLRKSEDKPGIRWMSKTFE